MRGSSGRSHKLLAMLETSPAEWVCAGDRDIIANGEPMQEMGQDKGIDHYNAVSLIAAKRNEASMEPGGAPDGADAVRLDRCLQV
jgi:hypothetical protein